MSTDSLSRPDADRRTVLVVDDEDAVRDILARWLVGHGWNCTQAATASDALAQLESHDVPIVVTDIHMPECSGMWLLEQVTQRFPDTAVLMLTGSNETRTAIDALTRGASAYLLKPIQSAELLFHVGQAWERRQLILERRQHLAMLERRVQEQTVLIRLAHEETIHRLVAAAGYRDEETGAHVRRTGLFSEALALAAGWSPAEAEQLRMAAPMHDVGKIGIPDAILKKPGALTREEYEIMKQHTTIGARMLAGSTSPVLQLAQKIALSHHERWDGTGYPHGLSGETIPEAARILAIADVYDALSHDRVYRPAFAQEAVISTMQSGQGSQFDPGLLALFFSVFEQIQVIAESHPDVAGHLEKECQPSTATLAAAIAPISGKPCYQ